MSKCIESSKDLNLGMGGAIGEQRGADRSSVSSPSNDSEVFSHLSAIIINIYHYLFKLAMRGK
jgi:hypothetical protein